MVDLYVSVARPGIDSSTTAARRVTAEGSEERFAAAAQELLRAKKQRDALEKKKDLQSSAGAEVSAATLGCHPTFAS